MAQWSGARLPACFRAELKPTALSTMAPNDCLHIKLWNSKELRDSIFNLSQVITWAKKCWAIWGLIYNPKHLLHNYYQSNSQIVQLYLICPVSTNSVSTVLSITFNINNCCHKPHTKEPQTLTYDVNRSCIFKYNCLGNLNQYILHNKSLDKRILQISKLNGISLSTKSTGQYDSYLAAV